ncbi:hypothetical protein BSZ35_19070 [Salinibacter sp. 10B]|uniref:hypothetical protein n=1 Tax=Salinibacter sp. 10B TaxID=1923971 RepID=UPI000CF4435B|nr:hypothetical protein [Salinibacter sp. 10B]PQJ26751.1 hypothetical protein BSZ35_19070 [Salinibacter sp. 10B]
MPIDTHQVFKHLKRDEVFSEEQADRLADALSEMDVASATKEDLNEVEERLNNRIDELDERLTQRIELSEERLGQKVEGIRSSIVSAVAAVGAVLAVVIPLSIYLFG